MLHTIELENGGFVFKKVIPHKFVLLPNGNIQVEEYFNGDVNSSCTTKVFTPTDTIRVLEVVEIYETVKVSDARYDASWGNWEPEEYDEVPTGRYEIGEFVMSISRFIKKIQRFGKNNILWDNNTLKVELN